MNNIWINPLYDYEYKQAPGTKKFILTTKIGTFESMISFNSMRDAMDNGWKLKY